MTVESNAIDPQTVPITGPLLETIVVESVDEHFCQGDTIVFVISKPCTDSTEETTAELPSNLALLDQKYLNSLLTEYMKKQECKAGYGCFETINVMGCSSSQVALASLGSSAQSKSPYHVVQVGMKIGASLAQGKAENAVICSQGFDLLTKLKLLQGIFIGLCPDHNAKYSKSPSLQRHLKKLSLTNTTAEASEFEAGASRMRELVKATYYSAELVQAPSNYATTVSLTNEFKELAISCGLECLVLSERELVDLNMGGILNVGRGSKFPPSLVRLTCQPVNSYRPGNTLVLIGKGITFDSGGYNLKIDYKSVCTMKLDMGGAASVMACARAISTMRPQNLRIHFITALCENMVNENAYRPGDVITMYNGLRVEVGNTDAEGRLTLGDVLTYGSKLGDADSDKPAALLTMATLTGAARAALGTAIAGVMSRHKRLEGLMQRSAEAAGELMHPLPSLDIYDDALKTKCGDLNNITFSGFAGATMAFSFLHKFASGIPFVHCDIAGTVLNSKNVATGYGAASLIELVYSLDALCSSTTLAAHLGPEEV